MEHWLLIVFLIFYPVLVAIKSKTQKKLLNKISFYSKNIIFPIILLLVLYLVAPYLYTNLNFNRIGRGIILPDEIISALFPIFFMPLIFSLITWSDYSKKVSNDKELFGYPIDFLPNNFKEYFFFSIYVIVGVLFEELICRQFMFFSFSETLHVRGDFLLIFTTFLFSIGHLYQGWKGILSAFIGGLFLGKIFQMSGKIFYPIVLHLFFNLTILVLAFKRLKKNKLDETRYTN